MPLKRQNKAKIWFYIHMNGILCFVKESKSIWEVLWSDEGLYALEGVKNA